MINLVEKVYEFKKQKIKVFPSHTNRASSIGDDCIRYLVYERTQWDKKQPHDLKLQLIFDEGNHQEPLIIRELMEAGITLIGQQEPFHDKKAQLTGHMDWATLHDGEAYPTEFKSLSHYMFDYVTKFDSDTGFHEAMQKNRYTRKYYAQVQCYMFFKEKEAGIFFCKNKSTGELKQFTTTLDIEYMDHILKRCEEINQHVENNTFPDKIDDRDLCKDCQFNHICLPGINFDEPLKVEDDPLFESKIDRCLSLKAAKDEYEGLNKQITASCRNRNNVVVGKYLITGKTDAGGKWRKNIQLVT